MLTIPPKAAGVWFLAITQPADDHTTPDVLGIMPNLAAAVDLILDPFGESEDRPEDYRVIEDAKGFDVEVAGDLWGRVERVEFPRPPHPNIGQDPHLRVGQAIYNLVADYIPASIRPVGSDLDPFYRDDRVMAFLKWALDLLTARQPAPVPCEGDVWTDIIAEAETAAPDSVEDFRARRAVGVARYGVPLQRNNGRDHLQDLKEELLDAVAYAYAADRSDIVQGAVGLLRALRDGPVPGVAAC